MIEIEKKAAIKKAQLEIDKRCSFFRIISDTGGKKPIPKKPKTSNPKTATLNT